MLNDNQQYDSKYVIPTVKNSISPFWLMLIFPIVFFTFGLLNSFVTALTWGITGFFTAIPFVIVSAFIVASRIGSRQRKIWNTHNYAWYTTNYPENIVKGRISCRHCGGSMHAKSMLNRTFMRLHSCTQCGETLYFTPEKV